MSIRDIAFEGYETIKDWLFTLFGKVNFPRIITSRGSIMRKFMLTAQDRIKQVDEVNPLVNGPLMKEQASIDLELIGKALIRDINSVQVETSTFGTITHLKYQGKRYKYSDLIEKANFQHIRFSDDEVKTLDIKFAWHPKQPRLPKIPKAYQCVVYRYSDSADPINAVLKPEPSLGSFGKYSILSSNIETAHKFLCMLRNMLLLASYLNTPSQDLVPTFTIRMEKIFSEAIHKARVEESYKGVVIENRKFLSSTVSYSNPDFEHHNTEICFTNLRGKHIELMSMYRREREFLLPPCQIRFISYQFDLAKQKHRFLAQIVDTPIEVKAAEEGGLLASFTSLFKGWF